MRLRAYFLQDQTCAGCSAKNVLVEEKHRACLWCLAKMNSTITRRMPGSFIPEPEPRAVQSAPRQWCGAVCIAWKDCGSKHYTHACLLPAGHYPEKPHKFPCERDISERFGAADSLAMDTGHGEPPKSMLVRWWEAIRGKS